MLAIRMQRTGRKGLAQFRVVVQDARLTPTSGRVVAQIGSYNPHTKSATIDKEKVGFYLTNGAQPSDRVARLLKNEGVELPKWVTVLADKERTIRNPEKLRKNQPEQPAEEAPAAEAEAEPAETPVEAEVATEAHVAEEAPAEAAEEKPTEQA